MTENMDIDAKIDEIPIITYNWNLIKICYELWDDVAAVNGNKKQLYAIAGVGKNYISNICTGKVKRSRKIFNSGNDMMLLRYLRGEISLPEINKLKKYIVFNNMFQELLSKKRQKKNGEEEKAKEGWLLEQCKDGMGINEYLKYLKECTVQAIKGESLRDEGRESDDKRTPLGHLKDYLAGRTSLEYIQGEYEATQILLMKSMERITCDKLKKMDEGTLENFYGCVKILFDRIDAERQYRRVRGVEEKLLNMAAQESEKKIKKI